MVGGNDGDRLDSRRRDESNTRKRCLSSTTSSSKVLRRETPDGVVGKASRTSISRFCESKTNTLFSTASTLVRRAVRLLGLMPEGSQVFSNTFKRNAMSSMDSQTVSLLPRNPCKWAFSSFSSSAAMSLKQQSRHSCARDVIKFSIPAKPSGPTSLSCSSTAFRRRPRFWFASSTNICSSPTLAATACLFKTPAGSDAVSRGSNNDAN
mmetsp:Transcript_39391/g.104453  ORF Transcript_39391/g.104453 Transcript_39391/m.104453 type:complete len:208 (+) Transcript_39391:1324-1947(+)